MKKVFKIILLTLFILVLFAVAGIFILGRMINPNQFKPLLISQIQKSTQKNVILDGNLSWSFYPNLGFNMGHVALNNPNKTKFLDVEQATLTILLRPLFHSQVELKGLTLSNVKLYLLDHKDTPDILGTVKVSGHFDLNKMTGSGQSNIDELQFFKMKLNTVRANFHFQNKVLTLDSLTGNLYQGILSAKGSVNLQESQPKIDFQTTFSKIETKLILDDLRGANQKLSVSGVGNIDLSIKTAGNNALSFKKNLMGSGVVKVAQGELLGIDVGYWIDSAYALVKHQEMKQQNTEKTPFGDLTASINIQNGVIQNKDLFLDAPRFETFGKGTIDLVNDQIDFSLQSFVKKISENEKNERDDWRNLFGLPVPIKIAGNLEKPHVRLDQEALIAIAVEKKFENAKDKIEEKIKENLPKAKEFLNNLLGH